MQNRAMAGTPNCPICGNKNKIEELFTSFSYMECQCNPGMSDKFIHLKDILIKFNQFDETSFLALKEKISLWPLEHPGCTINDGIKWVRDNLSNGHTVFNLIDSLNA